MWNATKTVLRGKCTALNSYQKRKKVSNLLKKLAKAKQMKPRVNRKGIMKIGVDRILDKIMKTKAVFLEN